MECQIDIWDNISECYDSKDGIWYKQSFIGDLMTSYEDSIGNYWDNSFGVLPYPKLIFLSNARTHDLKLTLNSNSNILSLSYQSRKLRVTWTPEMVQDVTAYHNIDAEAELTAMLSQHLANEIDREVVNMVMGIDPYDDDDETPEVNIMLETRTVDCETIHIENYEYRRYDLDGYQI